MSGHALVWRYSRDGSRPCGGDALLQWQLLESHGGPFIRYEAGPLNKLAETAIAAVAVGSNVTIGAWGACDPATMTPGELAEQLCDLRPHVLVCPERSVTRERREVERWIISYDGGPPASLPTAAIKPELARMVATFYPAWKPRSTESWIPTCMAVRPGISGEQLGLVEKEPLIGDRLLAAIANDPIVHEAYMREDASLPATSYALARARLEAQERMGIPPDQRVVLFSGQAESLLSPVVLRMSDDLMLVDNSADAANPGVRIPVLPELRRQLQMYRELADFVLTTALRAYPHETPALLRLREAAGVTARAAAA